MSAHTKKCGTCIIEKVKHSVEQINKTRDIIKPSRREKQSSTVKINEMVRMKICMTEYTLTLT